MVLFGSQRHDRIDAGRTDRGHEARSDGRGIINRLAAMANVVRSPGVTPKRSDVSVCDEA